MPAPPPVVKTVPLDRETDVRESNAVVLARIDGKRVAFVADEDDASIVEIELRDDPAAEPPADTPDTTPPPPPPPAKQHATTIGSRPRDLLILGDGTIAATLPDANAIAVFVREETGGLREVRRAKLPVEPMAMALGPKDDELYVSTGASHMLVALHRATLDERERWELPREPRAVLVSRDGARVFVSHAAESVLSIVEKGKGEPRVQKVGNTEGCFTEGGCSKARFARHANALVRAGGSDIVIPTAQTLPKPPVSFPMMKPTAPQGLTGFKMDGAFGGAISGYGLGDASSGPPVFMDLVTIDEKDGARVNGPVPVFHGTSCVLPRAAASTGDALYVACVGTNMIEELASPHGKSASATKKRAVGVARGPTGIAAERDGDHLVVWSSFARALTRLGTAVPREELLPSKENGMTKTTRLTLGTLATIEVPRQNPRDATWLRGRELFFANNDLRISKDGRACASCHVDGRDDGITWDTPMGPRRTRVLAGQVATGPYGWKGEHPTLEAHVKITFKQLGGQGLPDDELNALLTYVRSIPKPPARDDSAHARGKALFASAECASCHGGASGDRIVHDVGTGAGYMTPTLAGIGTKKQLMHDGRYATLDELLVGSKSMGTGSSLSPEDRQALVSYLQTL